MERSAIVAEARSWIGTPFVWQQSTKGVGCDCKGLVAGVARELGRPEAASVYALLSNYHAVDERLLRRGLAEVFDRAAEALPGDVLLLQVAGKAQHLAIVTELGRMVHTYGRGPVQRVIEVPIGRSRAIDSIWTWRGVE